MNSPSSNNKPERRSHSTSVDVAALRDHACDGNTRQRRASKRVNFIRKDNAITIQHPGGTITNFLVNTEDLSAGGISFLYGNFLHIGTMVVITLRRHRGGEEKVVGSVIRCRYVAGSMHEVGVKFKKPIFPQLFVDPMQWGQLQEAPVINAADLSGAVLLLDDQEMDRELFAHLLTGTAVKLTAVGSAQDAVAAVKQQVFLAACIDVNLGVGQPSGEQAGKMLRDAGFGGQLIVNSIEPSAPARVAKALGSNISLQKPFDQNQLFYALGMAMQVQMKEKVNPIFSSLDNRTHSRPLLERYVDQARRAAGEIHRLIETDDFKAVRIQCQSLRGTASGYGFEPVADAATNAVTALDAGSTIAEAEAELQVLQTLCRRLTAEEPS